MPRPERKLDDGQSPLTRFALELRALRDSAGPPSYRTLAELTNYSVSTLSEAAAGRTLPTLAVTLAYVDACSGDVAEWEQKWHRVAAELAAGATPEPTAQPRDDTTPYVGLAAFEAAEAHLFFGREKLVADLVERVGRQRFVAVFGASGAGKSSILRAGLVAAWTAQGKPSALFTPGAQPTWAYDAALASLGWTGDDRLLVVDQFEEVFTLCHDQAERERFLNRLLHDAQPTDGGPRLVIGVRTDFYGHCADDAALAEALQDSQFLVGPMTPDQLRAAITRPAVQAGGSVETPLLATVVADCAGEPGVLPLLSHALRETWRRRSGSRMTLAGYQAAGGITHAIAQTAEQTYEQFDDRGRQLAKSLFLRLIAVGEGTGDTKRRVAVDELHPTDPELTAVLARLTEARLVTVDGQHIEITHEALVRCWPRLSDWLAGDRQQLLVHRQLTDAASQWTVLHRDGGALYRGLRLSAARELADGPIELSATEREFLTASTTEEQRAATMTRRRTSRLRVLVCLLSVLLVAAGTLSVVAVRAQNAAQAAQLAMADQRDSAQAQTMLGEATTLSTSNPATAAQLSLAAYRLAPTPAARSLVLSSAAALHSFTAPIPGGTFLGLSPNGKLAASDDLSSIELFALDSDAHTVRQVGSIPLPVPAPPNGAASGINLPSSGSANPSVPFTVVNPSSPPSEGNPSGPPSFDNPSSPPSAGNPSRPPTQVTGPVNVPPTPEAATFSPDGTLMMIDYMSAPPKLYDTSDPTHPKLLATIPQGGSVTSFGSDRFMVTESTSHTVWDLIDPRHPKPVSTFPEQGLTSSFVGSADGKVAAQVIYGPDGDTVQVLDTSRPGPATQTFSVTVPGQAGDPIALNDGVLAVATAPGTIYLWRVSNPHDVVGLGTVQVQTTGFAAVAVNAGGTEVAASVHDAVDTWDLTAAGGPHLIASIPDNAGILPVMQLGFQTDRTVVGAIGNGGFNATQALWVDVPSPELSATNGASANAAFSPDGSTLSIEAVSNVNGASTQLWDVAQPSATTLLATLQGGVIQPTSSDDPARFDTGVGADAIFAPKGHLLATSDSTHGRLWDVTDPTHPTMLSVVQTAPVLFSPDGTTLFGADGSAWNVTDPHHPQRIPGLSDGFHGRGTWSLSSDGRLLAVADNVKITLYQLDGAAAPKVVGSIDYPGSAVAFAAGGRTLGAASYGGRFGFWNLDDPAKPILLSTVDGRKGGQVPPVFSANGQFVAIPRIDGSTEVLDVRDATHAVPFVVLDDATPIAFDPNGKVIAVDTGDGELQLRGIDVTTAIRQLCSGTPSISRNTWLQYLPTVPYQPPCGRTTPVN